MRLWARETPGHELLDEEEIRALAISRHKNHTPNISQVDADLSQSGVCLAGLETLPAGPIRAWVPTTARTFENAGAEGTVHLRILHLISGLSPRFGGPPKVLDLCEELSRQGLKVSLFTNDLDRPGSWTPTRANDSPYKLDDQPEKHSFEIQVFPTKWPTRFGYSPEMAREISNRIREFDIVHVHGLYLHPGLSGSFHARRSGVPYIIQPHGSLAPVIHGHHRYRKWLYEVAFERRNLNRAAALHFASTVEMKQAQQLGFTAPGLVLPLGVRLEEFDQLPRRGWFRQRYQLQDKRLVVFLGRLTPKKGLELLVDAFAIVAQGFPDAHLVIAGPDDENCGERISKQAQLRGLSSRVTLTGMLVGEERLGLFADTDVWILPSYDENFGIAAVEAMACRLPVVLSDNVHIGRQAAEAEAALIVPCEPQRLAKAVEDLLANPRLRRRLGHRARELVRREYTWGISAKRITEAYEAIIQSRLSRVGAGTSTGAQARGALT